MKLSRSWVESTPQLHVYPALLVTFVVTLLLVACQQPQTDQKTTADPDVESKKEVATTKRYVPQTVALVEQSEIPEIELRGVVDATTRPELVFEVEGIVEYVSPDLLAGKWVKKGALLAALDSREFDIAIEQANADMARAKANYEQEQALSEVAIAGIQAREGVTPSPLATRELQVEEAYLLIERARLQLAIATSRRKRSELRAPFDLVIERANVVVGERVSPRHVAVMGYDPQSLIVRTEAGWDQLQLLNVTSPVVVDIQPRKASIYRSPTALQALDLQQQADSEKLVDAELRFVGASVSATQLFPLSFTIVTPDSRTLKLGDEVGVVVQGNKERPLTKIPSSAIEDNGSIGLVSEFGRVVRVQPMKVGTEPENVLIPAVGSNFTHVIANSRVYIPDGTLIYPSNVDDTQEESDIDSLRL